MLFLFPPRAQSEQLSNVNSQLNSISSNQGLGVGQLSEQLESLDSRIGVLTDPANEFTTRGVLTTLKAIDDKVSSLLLTSSRQHRARHSSSSSYNTGGEREQGKQHHMQADRGEECFFFRLEGLWGQPLGLISRCFPDNYVGLTPFCSTAALTPPQKSITQLRAS